MEHIISDRAFVEAYLDMPFQPDTRGVPAHEAPGIHLKTLSRDRTGMPERFGKLAAYSVEKVVVISKPDGLCNYEKCVWIGTASQYACMWEVD